MLVWKDGRLAANQGSWSYVSLSPSRKQKCQVTVGHATTVRKRISDQDDPPSTGSAGSLPKGWVNRTKIFSVVPTAEITRSFAQMVAFNITSYKQEPNTAVWGLNFDGGNNPLVRWDGTYIGNQFE